MIGSNKLPFFYSVMKISTAPNFYFYFFSKYNSIFAPNPIWSVIQLYSSQISNEAFWLIVTSLFLSVGFITVVQLYFKLRHSYHMPSSGCCFQEERIIIHPIWVWLYQTLFKSATPWSLDSSPLCTQFRDPPSAFGDHPGLNIDLRTPAVPDRRHMVLLTMDSLETCSAQTHTHTHKSVCIFVYTHYTHRIHPRRWAHPHSEEKVAP